MIVRGGIVFSNRQRTSGNGVYCPLSIVNCPLFPRLYNYDSSELINERFVMRLWFRNIRLAIRTIAEGMYVTLDNLVLTFRRKAFTQHFEYPEVPVPIKARYRGFHRFDLTTCIGCDKCARACPVDCIYIEKEKAKPPLKGFAVTGFCALCVDPCPVDCIFMGSNFDLSCFSRDGCIVDYAKLPLEIAYGQATLNPTVVAASKKVALPVWTKAPEPPKAEAAPPAPV
jgi:NADH-quinone oxidoreductase subunit I